MTKKFLQAEWGKLAMVNYAVDKKILDKYLPWKTEPDLWNNTCYLSLVGFMFLNTRVMGVRIPFHTDFEEVNLRFYVRCKENGKWKRGVVFIKEIVSKPALAFVANTLYREKYETLPMKHQWETTHNAMTVEYKWKKKKWHSIKITSDKISKKVQEGSEEEFITDHYWGYTRLGPAQTSEYRVEHPVWKIHDCRNHSVNVDFGEVYGQQFDFLGQEKPTSVFLAEGSEITVNNAVRL